jgi:PIN domain nuclease of toxin-antitoxin system
VTVLLDTHVFLWWQTDSPRLKKAARQVIAEADLVYVSAVSGWEVAIKQGVGRITLSDPFVTIVKASHFVELPIRLRHAERVAALPPHHADPFDRMLIAQANVEDATIVTHDRQFEHYDVRVVWT